MFDLNLRTRAREQTEGSDHQTGNPAFVEIADVDDAEELEQSSNRGLKAISIGIAVVLIGGWQLSGLWVDPITVSTPYQIVRSIFTTWGHGQYGSLGSAVASSLILMGIAIGIGMVVGILTGLMMGLSELFRRAVEPLIILWNSSPTIAILPLMIIWFGFSHLADIIFIILLVIPTLTLNTALGSRITAEKYQDLRVIFKITSPAYLTRIVLPGSSPYIFTGLRVGVAHAIIGMILAGSEVGISGLGGLAASYGGDFATADVIGVIVVTTIMALVLYKIVEVLRARACPWVAHS